MSLLFQDFSVKEKISNIGMLVLVPGDISGTVVDKSPDFLSDNVNLPIVIGPW